MIALKCHSCINLRKRREINGFALQEVKDIFKSYITSFSFIYMCNFACAHYFIAKDSSFSPTLGLIMLDIMSNIVCCILCGLQKRRDGFNTAYRNKNMIQPYNIDLINKNLSANELISGYRMLAFLMVSIILIFYYTLGQIFFNIKFMELSDAFNFCMYFLSTAYFDVFFEGGLKKIKFNIMRIKKLTEGDKLTDKLGLYMMLTGVTGYQIYVFIGNLMCVYQKVIVNI